MSILECLDIRWRYGREEVLSGITFSVASGEIVAVLGKNGVGKTTLFKVLAGLLPPRWGTIRFLGEDAPLGIGSHEETMFLFEDMAFLDFFSASENVRALEILNSSAEGNHHVLDELGQSLMASRKRLGWYSHGMRQRFALAALAGLSRRRLMVLDEPTNGLDYSALLKLEGFMTKSKEDGVSILVSSHYLEFVKRNADRIIVLERGRILEDAPVTAISTERLHDYLS